MVLLTRGNPNSSTAPVWDSHFLGSDSSESFHPGNRITRNRSVGNSRQFRRVLLRLSLLRVEEGRKAALEAERA